MDKVAQRIKIAGRFGLFWPLRCGAVALQDFLEDRNALNEATEDMTPEERVKFDSFMKGVRPEDAPKEQIVNAILSIIDKD